jgi:protein gp37
MSDITDIAWCHHTASPHYGCHKVSAGCIHCYMFEWMKRAGLDTSRLHKSKSFHKECRKWNQRAMKEGSVRERVFPSLCDPFDLAVPFEWFNEMMVTIDACRQLDFLLLTKRPENVMPLWNKVMQHWHGSTTPNNLPSNVWLGVTAENQAEANRRIPILKAIPAAVRFLSCEPLLEPIVFDYAEQGCSTCDWEPKWQGGIDWVIVGGESGPKRRDCGTNAIANIVTQCQAAGVACFVKQDCHLRPGQKGRLSDQLWSIKQFPTINTTTDKR